MKKIILFMTMAFVFTLAHSQSLLSFCTYVNSANRECVFDNTKFITTPDSTSARLFMFLQSAQPYNTTRLSYKVYGIDRFGAEVYLRTITQEVQPDWQNSWQPSVFNSPGKYMIKVYKGESDTLIANRGFEFFNY